MRTCLRVVVKMMKAVVVVTVIVIVRMKCRNLKNLLLEGNKIKLLLKVKPKNQQTKIINLFEKCQEV